MEQLATKIAQLKRILSWYMRSTAQGKHVYLLHIKTLQRKQQRQSCRCLLQCISSEDLFVWDNDEENNGQNIRLMLQSSTLNQYHQLFDEDKLREHLTPYKPKFDFRFHFLPECCSRYRVCTILCKKG